MRYLCAADLFLSASDYATCEALKTDDYFGMSVSAPSEKVLLSTRDRNQAIENEALLTCDNSPRPHWCYLIHILALANVLKRPVNSLYPENTNFPYRDVYHKQFVHFNSTEPLSSTHPLYILWSVDGTLPHSAFHPNHFVCLVPNDAIYKMSVSKKAPITIKKGQKRQNSSIKDFFQLSVKSKKFETSAETSAEETNEVAMKIEQPSELLSVSTIVTCAVSSEASIATSESMSAHKMSNIELSEVPIVRSKTSLATHNMSAHVCVELPVTAESVVAHSSTNETCTSPSVVSVECVHIERSETPLDTLLSHITTARPTDMRSESQHSVPCVPVEDRNIHVSAKHKCANNTTNASNSRYTPEEIEHLVQYKPKNIQFPKRVFGHAIKSNRQFQPDWFDIYPWLHYDERDDKAFCYDCLRAHKKSLITQSKLEQSFISDGCTNWKDAKRKFIKHQNSECHREATARLKIPVECKDIKSSIGCQVESEQSKCRDALMVILSNLRFLARQGLPFRGNSNDENSNFKQINKLRAEDSVSFQEWLNRKSDKYDSPAIQNELLNIMSCHILREIAEKIQKSDYFAIMADETTDMSNREQLVICLRWVDDKTLEVHEDLIGLYQIDQTNAETIARSIKDALVRINVTLSKCRGQTYDGAATMAGRKSGVQSRIKEEEPRALFNHCHGHLINLACADSIKSSKVMNDSLSTCLEITKLIKKSPQRDTKLERIRQASGEGDSPNIRQLCPTRWTVKANAMASILQNYSNLMELWEWSIDHIKDTDMKARIRGVQAHMKKFDFLFGLILGETLLRNADNLSATVQRKDMTAAESKSVAMKTAKTLSSLRTDENFDLFWGKVNKIAELECVDNPALPRQRKMPARYETGNAQAEYHSSVQSYFRHIYFEAIDLTVSSIKGRYDNKDFNLHLQVEQLLLKCVTKSEYESEFVTVTEFYGDDLNQNDLQYQLTAFGMNFESEKQLDDVALTDIITYFQLMPQRERKWLSEVLKLLKLVLVMPATNATSERSFSSLRRIKSYLRSTMTQCRLNSLMLINIHKDYVDNINLQEVAQAFVNAVPKRKLTFGNF